MLVLQSVVLSVGIEVFGWVTNVVRRYLDHSQNSTSGSEEEKIIQILSQKTCVCKFVEVKLRFWPPLCIQRYIVIEEILNHPIWNGSIKKVVEFGCSDLSLFKHLKSIPELNSIMFVDVDFNTLDKNLNKVMPINSDYFPIGTRTEQLIVDVYNGSIAVLDDRMLGVDAVIGIELIEHLYSEVLNAVPFTVFEFIKPKLAVFTTPNVEFNALFPNFTTQFRHDDHKFEWTRKQLKEWAEKITTRYPDYTVQFDGIGSGPFGTESLGCCTQMAIFYRKDMKTSPVEPIGCTPYKLLRRVSFPFEQYSDNYIRERTIFDKLEQFISENSSNEKYIVRGYMEVLLKTFMPYVTDCCSSTDELEEFVSKLYKTKKNDDGEWLLVRPSSEFGSDTEISDSYSNHNEEELSTVVLEDGHNYNDEEDWSPSNSMSFGESTFYFSTPMAKNIESKINANNVDSFNTAFINSDFYNAVIDYNMTKENRDENISSSSNCNDDYNDFTEDLNNSVIGEEGITVIEKTVMCSSDSNELFIDNDTPSRHIIIKNNTIIENNSNTSLKSNASSGTTQNVCSENSTALINNSISGDAKNYYEEENILNKTLLDESGFTESMLD